MDGLACGGICLRQLHPTACPPASDIDRLPTCDQLVGAPAGTLCEADGECGTSRTANNCHGNQDVYERCANVTPDPPLSPPAVPAQPPPPGPPPPPPHPPVSPLPLCDAAVPCAAGGACGVCLRLAGVSECPASGSETDALVQCGSSVPPGTLCEADGECGTSRTANNCHGWRDVYVREACVPAATPLSGPAASSSAASRAASAIAPATAGFLGEPAETQTLRRAAGSQECVMGPRSA